MPLFDGLHDRDVLEMALEDFRGARTSRQQVEERKLADYELYRRFRRELPGGGINEESAGPHGWSKLTIPLVFWIVETILPRIGVQPPTLTVNAANPAAVPYAQAKQLRIQRQLKRGAAEAELLMALKQFLILGDGPLKTPWDTGLGGPRILALDWFDFFLSPECRRWHDAEVIWHRTWHTRRDIRWLIERDAAREVPLYDHMALERVANASNFRDSLDTTYAQRREAAGLGPVTFGNAEGQVAICEGWYRDGSLVVIAGDESPELLRLEREPLFKDLDDQPLRPFAVLQNTPDLFLPYSISDAEMLEDHQHEASTLRNAGIDQATGNIFAPKVYNSQKVRPEEVRAAFEQPNGLLPVNGDVSGVIEQFPPGSLSADFERVYEQVRSEAQMISGVSDISAGQPTSFGLDNSTATGMSIIREEANQRYRMKLKLIQLGMQRVAQNFDAMDRRMSTTPVNVPVEQGFQPMADARGIQMAGPSFARVSPEVNAPGLEYEIEVDAGAMAPPHQMEQAQRMRALIMDMQQLMGMGAPPQMFNMPEIVRMVVESHGHAPEKILIPLGAMMGPPGMPGAPMGQMGPPGPGEEPIGPPEPLDALGPPDGRPMAGPIPTPA